jgi:transposase
MAQRTRPALSDDRRLRLVAELRIHAQVEEQARLNKCVHISMAYDAGMTLAAIAEVYNISRDTAQRWKAEGERERERRRGGDPERSGESEQVS